VQNHLTELLPAETAVQAGIPGIVEEYRGFLSTAFYCEEFN
jgi:hypothetical protein